MLHGPDAPLSDVPEALDSAAFRARLPDPGLISLIDHWQDKAREGHLPSRRDIDPSALKSILSDTYILETDEDGTLRFRLAGSGLRAIFGREATGETLDAVLSGQDLENARRCYATAARLAAPWLTRNLYDLGQGDRFAYLRLVCPLARDGVRVDGFLGAFAPRDIFDPPRTFQDISERIEATLEREEAILATR
jgi:hypothetical protein